MKTLLIIAAVLCLLSGTAWGLHEALTHHYSKFAERFPTAGTYWRAAEDCDERTLESWTLKYKNGDPKQGPAFVGSTTFLVWTTDAKHLFSSLAWGLFPIGAALGLYAWARYRLTFPPAWQFGVGLLLAALVRIAGFHAVYTLYFH